VRFEVAICPETFVRTGKTTFPLTTTFLSSSAGKRVPGASIEEMPCSVRTTSGVPEGIVTANDVSTIRKARLAIAIQIKVCFFIYPNVREEVRLVYWTWAYQRRASKFKRMR